MILPLEWTLWLLEQPESGMGYRMATIHLRDGRSFENQVILNADTIETDEFAAEEIRSIELTGR